MKLRLLSVLRYPRRDDQGNVQAERGVAIEYDANRDAINDIINRINASTAGVTATYDVLSDSLVLASKETGGLTITMDDVGGNFLSAVGLAGAEQEYGKNALFRVDGVQDGAQLSSASNTVSGILTNVTLTLKDVARIRSL